MRRRNVVGQDRADRLSFHADARSAGATVPPFRPSRRGQETQATTGSPDASARLPGEKLLRSFGTIGLFAIIFAESGLMVGFFLPGDSLLFAAGLFAAQGHSLNIAVITVGCAARCRRRPTRSGTRSAARVGRRCSSGRTPRLFKQEYLAKSEEFFEHYGAKAIILARFVPIVRTFVPVVAGAGSMNYRTFPCATTSSVVCSGPCCSCSFGYWLGKRYPWLVDKIDVLAVVIITFSLIPIGISTATSSSPIGSHGRRRGLRRLNGVLAGSSVEPRWSGTVW